MLSQSNVGSALVASSLDFASLKIAFSASLVSNFSYNYCAALALSTATVLFASLFASL